MISTNNIKDHNKFYTRNHVVEKILKKINFHDYDFVIEPSAGDGAFLKKISHKNKIGLDIAPDDDDIIKKDWFKYKIEKKYENVLVIGNPPFGKRNKLSIDFIKHATNFENVKKIAFILPNVFKKYTLQKHIPKCFKINEIIPIPKNAYYSSKNDCIDIPTSFFIMSKNDGNDLRQNINEFSNDFSFVTKNDDFDFFIFGSAPKKRILKNEKEKISNTNRGYYIKSNIKFEKIIKKFEKINWKGHSSVNGGVYWLTKIDILENYNRYEGDNNERK